MRVSWRDFLAVAALLLVLAGVLYKTIFLGAPVSRVALLAHWDSFFDDQAHGFNMSLDPTTILLYVPTYFLVGSIWRSGILPLWNPLSGCGQPLVGDIESNIFSPCKLLFALHPGLKTYNFILIGEVAGALIGTYLLARVLRLSRLPSIYAAITFSFCPYILYYLELTNGPAACFFPFVFIAFALLARRVNALTVFFAAATCSVLIFAGHPESSFFGIMSGVLLAFCLRLFDVFDNSATSSSVQSVSTTTAHAGQRAQSLLGLVYAIGAAGLFTFAFCAPVLLPFTEYLRNSECYKFVVTSSLSFISWRLILFNLIAPCFAGTSPYLGAAMLPMIAIGCFYRSKLWKALMLSALVLFLIITQVGPLRMLLSHTILANVSAFYALTPFLLILCLIGAYGTQCFYKKIDISIHNPKIVFAISICALQIVLAVFIRIQQHNITDLKFDIELPLIVGWHVLQTVILCTLLFTVILLSKKLWQYSNAMICAVIVASWLSMAPTIASSLPVQPRFDYHLKEPLTGFDLTNNRLLSLGEHLFRPNTNWVFGISDFRSEKSLFPSRYPQFMIACGARADSHMQIFVSVRYLEFLSMI